MKYLVLYWSEYERYDRDGGELVEGWVVWSWETNRRTAVVEFNKCRKSHQVCKMVEVGKTLAEQTACQLEDE